MTDPILRSKQEYAEILSRISNPDSPVGIDAVMTHAIIIGYLQDITQRLERIEEKLENS